MAKERRRMRRRAGAGAEDKYEHYVKAGYKPQEEITVYLVGNPNVGKSVIFNYLTGKNAIVSNYPGTTVTYTTGTTIYKGRRIKVIDLPGVYSLAGVSMDHIITETVLLNAQNGIILNIVDATNLERDLYLTMQLVDRKILPIVMVCNMADELRIKGKTINTEELSSILETPVVLASGIQGWGITRALDIGIEEYEKWKLQTKRCHREKHMAKLEYPDIINVLICTTARKLKGICSKANITPRGVAIGLIEGDPVIHEILKKADSALYEATMDLVKKYGYTMGIDTHYALIMARREKTREITSKVVRIMKKEELKKERIDRYTTYNPYTAYPILASVLISITLAMFFFGGFLEEVIDAVLDPLFEAAVGYARQYGPLLSTIVDGVLTGINAGLSIVIPYILTFYLILGVLEDTGYLSRIAFLADKAMHKVGVHGRALIPIIVGMGCNVPAVMGTRIMDTEKERKISAVMASMVPCSARTVVIIGIVGIFVGFAEAIAIYLFSFALVFLYGKIASRYIKGETLGLVMEIPPYRIPKIKNVLLKTWIRTKDFIHMAFPLLIAGSILISALVYFGLAGIINLALSPITNYLGLPDYVGITLIFGIIRKEMTIEILAILAGTTNFGQILTPVQLWVYALLITLYFPCVGTLIALRKEYGTKFAIAVAVSQILTAIAISGGMRILLNTLGYR